MRPVRTLQPSIIILEDVDLVAEDAGALVPRVPLPCCSSC